MTREQIEAILKSAQAKSDKENGYVLPEGSNLTLHVAYQGASLSFGKLEALRFDGELIFARNARQTVALATSDVFAVTVEGGQQRRAAGFSS